MFKVLVLALGIVVVLKPKTPDKPVMNRGVDGVYTIKNPLNNLVRVNLHCGFDYEDVPVDMGPQSTQTVRIIEPGPEKHPAHCWIDSYSVIQET